MRVSLSDFMANVNAIAAERPDYNLGSDGSNGECDCIGLVIGAIRRSGGTWDGVHGTNYTIRNAVDYYGLTADYPLTVGMLVFKARNPGDNHYDLPSRYKDSADQRDYYHVGVVTSVEPLAITHCTSPGGIKEDTALGAWKYCAWCSEVEGGAIPAYEPHDMVVTAQSGKTVNLRARPSTSSNVLCAVKIGETVTVTGESGEWAKVAYSVYSGYMRREYLTEPAQPGDLLMSLYAARDAIDAAIRAAEAAK